MVSRLPFSSNKEIHHQDYLTTYIQINLDWHYFLNLQYLYHLKVSIPSPFYLLMENPKWYILVYECTLIQVQFAKLFYYKFRCISTLIPKFNSTLNWFEANASNASGVKCKLSKYIKLRTKLPQYKEIFVFLKDSKAYEKKFDNTLSCYSSPKASSYPNTDFKWWQNFSVTFLLQA